MAIESKIIYKNNIPYKVTLEVTKLNESLFATRKAKKEAKRRRNENLSKYYESIFKIVIPKYEKVAKDYIKNSKFNKLRVETDYEGYEEYALLVKNINAYEDLYDTDFGEMGRFWKGLLNALKNLYPEDKISVYSNKDDGVYYYGIIIEDKTIDPDEL